MADRVVLHIGTPKSGTSYLQHWLWRKRNRLAEDGVLLPGNMGRQALATHVVREDPAMRKRPGAMRTWDELLEEMAEWSGTAVVSHEFFGAATQEQAARALADLAPARVEIVVSARDALGALTAAWQESLKYGDRTPLEDFSLEVSPSPMAVWNWRNIDAAEVLDRWAPLVSADRVHVVTVPKEGSPAEPLWDRFAGVFLEEPSSYEVTESRHNPSMGVVQAEVLRRVTPYLSDLPAGRPVRRWLRDHLGRKLLAGVDGERFRPSLARVEECRQRSDVLIDRVVAGGFHLVGSVEDLRVADGVDVLRSPADVSEAEVAEEAARVVGALLLDLRKSQSRLHKLRRQVVGTAPEEGPAPKGPVRSGALRRALSSLRDR